VLYAWGFVRELLAKPTLFKNLRTGRYYIGVQAGGDDFWRSTDIVKHEDTLSKLSLWSSTQSMNHAEIRGAPRLWSHGLKEISQEEADKILKQWHACDEIIEEDKV
jgi:hypothetical protein